jgi:hypothetical protein
MLTININTLRADFGLPLPLVRICKGIFEALPADEATAFFAALPDSVARDGKDLSRVHWRFLAAELRSLPGVLANVQAVIDPVIAGLDRLAAGGVWDATDAEAAGAAAYAAAYAAADAAAYAAAYAAYAAARAAADVADAAYAAYAAAYAARAALVDAARADARRRQRDTVLRLIADA